MGNDGHGHLDFGDGGSFGSNGQMISLGAVTVLIGNVVDGVRFTFSIRVTVSTKRPALKHDFAMMDGC